MNELTSLFGANGNQNAADGEAQVQKQHTCSTQKTRFFGYGG